MTTEASPVSTSSGGDIVAKAGRYYRNTRYLMCAMLVGMGLWFAYDGWVSWPRQNSELAALQAQQEATRDDAEKQRLAAEIKKYEHRNDSSILIQKLLGCSLPPLGIALLAWAFHRSRGEYRLSGTKLSVPGHPTIDLDDIKSVNNDLWDRKGIVWLKYETPNAPSGEIVLDDFIYDRPPTDAIYDRIADKFGLNVDDEDEDENENDDDDGEEQAEQRDERQADESARK